MKVDLDLIKGERLLKLILLLDGEKFYIVGGCVRDLLLHKSLKDVDIVVERLNRSFIKNFLLIFGAESYYKSQFLTFKIETSKGIFDIARARGEYYEAAGKLPRVYPVYDIVKDLKRRDFTINSMAIELWPRTFKLIDPLGGLEDLKGRILRVNKRGSFIDDPTRAFRAIRYRYRFGLSYDKSTEIEFENLNRSLPNISFARVRNEIARVVCEEKRFLMLKEIGERGILKIWDESFNCFDVKLLEELDRILPRTENKWFYFLIPFGLENYFKKNPLNFKVSERKILELLFKSLDLSLLSHPSGIHSVLKDAEADTVRVWGSLKGVKQDLLMDYLSRRDLLKNSIRLNVLIKRLGNFERAKKAYNLLVHALLDGEIEPGEEEEFLRKILPNL
ncbi:MAG: hypothetical protein QMD82_03390 [bacterium]|nr:hypothetical protein [bacterium]